VCDRSKSLGRVFSRWMLRFAVSRTARAPNAAVWRVLGDFGTEHRWNTSVSECRRNTESVRVGTVLCGPAPCQSRSWATPRGGAPHGIRPGRGARVCARTAGGPVLLGVQPVVDETSRRRCNYVTVEGRFAPRNRWVRFVVWPLATLMLRRLTRRVIGELETSVVAQSLAPP
jgi:hypothetical protein